MWGHKKFDIAQLNGKRILDIGCGQKKSLYAIRLDIRPLPKVDIVADLNQPLPVGDGSFDVVFADQVLEHIQNLTGLMGEIHRVLRPGGLLVAHVPYFRSAWAHIDPTHVRCFTASSLDYFVKGTYCHDNYRFGDLAFSSKEAYLDSDYWSTPLRALFSRLTLRWPFYFENSIFSFLYPFEQLTFVLTK